MLKYRTKHEAISKIELDNLSKIFDGNIPKGYLEIMQNAKWW
jgi:hypothetical protein